MPAGWTPEKEDAQEAVDEAAIAIKMRAQIATQRANLDFIKVRADHFLKRHFVYNKRYQTESTQLAAHDASSVKVLLVSVF